MANDHRPNWVGAALSGPSRHCRHGLQQISTLEDTVGCTNQSNCLGGELNRRSRKGVGSPPCQVLAHTHIYCEIQLRVFSI